jgi:hypothetical protein
MAIAASDLEFRYSNPDASAGNQLAQASPAASLGGYISQTVWAGEGLHDLFAALSGADNRDLKVEYRCLFFLNKHEEDTLEAVKVWLTAQTAGGADVAIGLDPTAASPVNYDDLQALTEGVTFSAPTTSGAGLALGDLPPGHCRAVWVRRTAAASEALDEDAFSVKAEGDSPE